ncbi:MAG: ABC transporter substrate-binding protein [Candidatus Thermoplasmatota archaeon]|jgi:ABC-type transport system substrate-binding protein|nr:ABC transporter substrate-binding protein [Cuniculiplasma sp.]MCL4320246.1 ABC transporter substrate-binding protein [Candidatus Thermoplasmatota archaeon]MCL6014886.1 ABC transporter substrate-binding protein [Candidatus Thermoplasmatota archaeon]
MKLKKVLIIFVASVMIASAFYGAIQSGPVPGKGSLSDTSSASASSVTSNSSTLNMGLLLSDYAWSTLNPFTTTYSASGLNYLFYTPLVTIGYPPEAGIHAGLLKTWSSNPSYTVWNLTLRSNLKWDNGQPMTSTDLAFSLNLYNNSATDTADYFGATMVHNATIINSTTVQLVFKSSYPSLLNFLAGGEADMVYAPSFENIPASQLASFTNEKNIVLDSPYVITNYTTGENPLILTRNPYYYQGQPYYKYLKIILFDSTTAEISALSSGEIQIAWDGGSYTSAKAFKVPGYSLHTLVPSGEEVINLNYMQYPMNMTSVRQALAYAVNRETLAHLGYGSENYTLLNYATLTSQYDQMLGLTSSQIPNYTQSQSKVDSLMESSGFKLVNGYWENSTGSTVTIKVIYPNYETGATDISVELSTMWETAGFKVQLTPLTTTDFTSTLASADQPTYGAAVWDGYGFGIPLNSFITNIYTFFYGYLTPAFDKSLGTSASALYGTHLVKNGTLADVIEDYINASAYPFDTPRSNYWNRELAMNFANQVPMIPLYYTTNFEEASNSVYWGNATNHTGIFDTQSLTMPQFWDGTLMVVHPIITKSTFSDIDLYIIVAFVVIIAAVAVGVGYNIKKKKNKEKED